VDQLDQIVGFEAQQQVPFPLTEAVWDYQTLGNTEDIEVEVVLVAIKAEELEAINQVVRSNGFETGKVDLAPLALYNAFRYNYPDVDQTVLLIDIGARSTNLIYVEGTKFFVRSINAGAREVTEQSPKSSTSRSRKPKTGRLGMGLSHWAEAMRTTRIRRSRRCQRSSAKPSPGCIRKSSARTISTAAIKEDRHPLWPSSVGREWDCPGSTNSFRRRLKIPVESFNALRNVELGRKVDHAAITSQAHALGELIGLGLRGAGPNARRNRLGSAIGGPRAARGTKVGLFWMAGLSFALVLAAAGLFYQRAAAYAEERRSALEKEVASLKSIAGKIAEQEDRLAAIRTRSKPYSEAVLGRVYWITTFRDLSEAIVDDKIWFVEMQPMSRHQSAHRRAPSRG